VLIRLLLGFALAYLLSLVAVPTARRAALQFGIVDAPDGRLKSQGEPVPYFGGLAVFVSFLLSLGMTFEFDQEVLGLLLAGSIVATLGLIDDFGVLTPRAKILGQVVAVFVLLKSGVAVHLVYLPPWARLLLTVVWLVGVSNAFNLMDIMDGLAGGVATIAAMSLLVLATLNGRWVVAAFTVALLGALLGFLRFNFHPAAIYLGDCGSLFLGLVLGALAMVIDYTQHNPLGFLAPLLILGLPLADTAYVSLLRIRAGRKIYHGSPDHFPLRLRRRLGGSVVRTVLLVYGAATVLGAAGVALVFLDPIPSLWLFGALVAAGGVVLLWLARVPMEAE
jgi:UDP-GlcNAc:undecaprenyl-phosphate/decaprenyl-phosphate GlcNAc-1-phosphate transferase